MKPNGAMTRIEIYGGDRHLATYDIASNATYFIHGDWQGTERVRSKYDGTSYETCSNLPFGDGQQCVGATDVSPLHFTGKMRDTETNLDYFGARYFSSGMGRWMSPDWAAKPTTVPYAQFGDPQSLNLYDYVSNSPVSKQDGDGHLISIYHQYNDHGGSSGSQELLANFISIIGDQMQKDLIQSLQHAAQQDSQTSQSASPTLTEKSATVILRSNLTSEQAIAFEDAVLKASTDTGVDPNLLVGVAMKESSLHPDEASSSSSAEGLFPSQQVSAPNMALANQMREARALERLQIKLSRPLATFTTSPPRLLLGGTLHTLAKWV